MKEDVKKLWVDALRSSEYLQARGGLRASEDSVTSYCCLGVLCELYRRETGKGGWNSSSIFEVDIYRAYSYLPLPVMKWAGLVEEDPEASDGSLSSMNDAGYTFARIADVIEAEL